MIGVVFIYERKNDTLLYLMHALAVDVSVHPFVGEKDIWLIDDCPPDIFTNVKGPIVCAKDQLSFLVE